MSNRSYYPKISRYLATRDSFKLYNIANIMTKHMQYNIIVVQCSLAIG